jgi:recombination protein RecA
MDRKSLRYKSKLKTAMIENAVKKYGEGATLLLSSDSVRSSVSKVIPTFSPELDKILAKDKNGNYGMPVGRIVGISGREACGKTTLSVMIMKSVQQMGGLAHLVETENAFDPAYAEEMGVNLDDLLISQPAYLEQALDIIKDDAENFKNAKAEYIEETGEKWDVPMVIVLDSIAGVPPKVETDADSFEDEQARALHARKLSKFFRVISSIISKEEICLICTNQTKTDTNVRYGSKATEIGGAALKFHASLRLDLWRSGFIKESSAKDAEPIGIETTIKTIKNKVMAPFKMVTVPILFGIGIDYATSLFNLLLEQGFIKKTKLTFELNFSYKPKGKRKVEVHIKGVKKKFMPYFRKILETKKAQKKLTLMAYGE